MALPAGCEVWEYEDAPNAKQHLVDSTRALLAKIGALSIQDRETACSDTRQCHADFFRKLIPASSPYYAGHYRGENFRCLLSYEVRIPSDARVGHAAATVPLEMSAFALDVRRSFQEARQVFSAHDNVVPKNLKLLALARITAALFVYFLEIHPYANGNGHMGRLIAVTLLSCLVGFPRRFPIDPRPKDPPYSELIKTYRDGDREKLELYLLNCL